jgi:hypothetical protein
MTKEEYENRMSELLNRWQEERKEYNDEEKGFCFTTDGILDFDIWEKQHPKILFLLKETHDDYTEVDQPAPIDAGSGNYFWWNIARWKFAISQLFLDKNINPIFLDKDELLFRFPFLDDIAIVEVKKKYEDKSISNNNEIKKYAKRDAKLLREQIDLINPNIVLCCYTQDSYDLIYEGVYYEEISPIIKKCRCWKFGERLVIDFYHPSTRTNSRAAELFNILCRMIKEGDVFNKFDWGKK